MRRSNLSTDKAHVDLIETIRKTLGNEEIVSRVFIDLKKAVDTVNDEFLLGKLNHY